MGSHRSLARSVACALLLLELLALAGCHGQVAYRPWDQRPLAAAGTKPLLVVDIDDTLVSSPAGSLYALAPIWPRPPQPLPGAAAALGRLSRDYRILYLSARGAFVACGTLRWLDRCGFPRGPLVLGRGVQVGSARHERYKVAALSWIEQQAGDIAWGIGDKAHDMAAYARVGARTILIADGPRDPDLLRARSAGTTLPPDHVFADQANAWAEIEALLRTTDRALHPRAHP